MNKNRKYWVFAGVGTMMLILVIVGIGYTSGYRIQSNLSIGKVGILTLTVPLSGTTVFVDDKIRGVTTKDNEGVKISLSPQTHVIIVSRTGYYPWSKKIQMESSKTLTYSPFIIPQNTSGVLITKTDKEYSSIVKQIKSDVLLTLTSPRFSNDKSEKLWLENNTLMATIASTTYTVLTPQTKIRNVDFYKDRNDTVLFSTANGVFIIEIDKEGGQNFMPVYLGVEPVFIKPDPSYIYVLDGENLMQVII